MIRALLCVHLVWRDVTCVRLSGDLRPRYSFALTTALRVIVTDRRVIGYLTLMLLKCFVATDWTHLRRALLCCCRQDTLFVSARQSSRLTVLGMCCTNTQHYVEYGG